MAPTTLDQKVVNLWVARVIPIVLVGIVGYVTWVVIVLVCGQQLIDGRPAFILTGDS